MKCDISTPKIVEEHIIDQSILRTGQQEDLECKLFF